MPVNIDMELRAFLQRGELRALQGDRDTAGGFTIGGRLLAELIKLEARESAMRRLCRVIPDVEGDELTAPLQRQRLSDAEWTTEIATRTADGVEPFGELALKPHPLAKRIRVSNKLLRSNPLAEQFILEMLADAVAVPEELAFLRGDGSGEPLGLLNTPGIGSYTTAGAGALTIADVKRWIYTLPASYHTNATALMHVDTARMLAELDTAGALIQGGRLLGRYPIEFSDQFPSAGTNPASLANGAQLAVFGDFRAGYIIADGSKPALFRLTELYAASNELGLQVEKDTDGGCAVPRAFTVLTVQ
jgi:HK97 family phage major capsid protein